MKYLRILFAIILLPIALSLGFELVRLMLDVGVKSDSTTIPFWVGFFGYFAFQFLFDKPIKTYIFGHEFTHALFGLISGAKLKSFHVSSSGGSVELTKTNLIVTLAPYFVPIYTTLLVILYKGAGLFWSLDKYYAWFLALAGFTLAFHFALTHFAIMQGQSDMKRFGNFFSGVFIIIVNCIFLAVLLKLLFPQMVDLAVYFKNILFDTKKICMLLYEGAKNLWFYFQKMK